MAIQKEILDELILDSKKRVVELVNDFGDIVFRENNNYGETVYSICRIFLRSKHGFSDGIEKKRFFFEIKIIDTVKNRNPLLRWLGPLPMQVSDDDQYVFMGRYELVDEMVQKNMGR